MPNMLKETTGKRIRSLRLDKHMSIADLASVVGVSKSLICQLERGDIYPSLATLEKIVDSLDVNLSTFFQVEGQTDQDDNFIVRDGTQKLVLMPKSNNKYFVLTYNLRDSDLEFLLVEYPVNTDVTQVDIFSHGGKEYFYILQGEIELNLGDATYHLHQGDSGCFDSANKHYYVNTGTKPAKVLVAATKGLF